MTTTDELLTSTQAGVILRKSAKTVTRLGLAGALPIAQQLPGPNGAYLFRPSDVAAYAAAEASEKASA